MFKLILIAVIAAIIGFVIGWFCYKSKVKELSDEMPTENRNKPTAYAMQLSNELSKYFYEKNNKICIKVVKK